MEGHRRSQILADRAEVVTSVGLCGDSQQRDVMTSQFQERVVVTVLLLADGTVGLGVGRDEPTELLLLAGIGADGGNFPAGLGGRGGLLDADAAVPLVAGGAALDPDADMTIAGGCLPSCPSLPSKGLKLLPLASQTNTPDPRAVASSMVDLPPPPLPLLPPPSSLRGWNANGPHPAPPPEVCVEWLRTTLGMCGLFERRMAMPCGPDRAIAVPAANEADGPPPPPPPLPASAPAAKDART